MEIKQGMFAGLNGEAKNNKFTVWGYTIYNIVLIACYIIEVIKGSRTLSYVLVFSLLSILPLVAIHLAYRRDKESTMIKNILMGSYAISYCFTMFTTVTQVAFVYAILVSLFIISYCDLKASTQFGVGFVLINIVNII